MANLLQIDSGLVTLSFNDDGDGGVIITYQIQGDYSSTVVNSNFQANYYQIVRDVNFFLYGWSQGLEGKFGTCVSSCCFFFVFFFQKNEIKAQTQILLKDFTNSYDLKNKL